MRRSHRAFSLVEMLVVISLITLLISILMPSLGRAKKRARAVKCMSNQHQMLNGWIAMADSYNGRLFDFRHGVNDYWHTKLLPYVGQDPKTYLCPEATEDANYGTRGDAFHAWGPGGGWMNNMKGSYGLNLWLLPRGDFPGDSNIHPEGFIHHTDNATSEMPVFGDSPWVGSWPDDQDFYPNDLVYGLQQHRYQYFMGRFCVDRHSMAVNIGFADASARLVQLPDLWQLQWHADFKPGEPGSSVDP